LKVYFFCSFPIIKLAEEIAFMAKYRMFLKALAWFPESLLANVHENSRFLSSPFPPIPNDTVTKYNKLGYLPGAAMV
jgi:hypothetical protein